MSTQPHRRLNQLTGQWVLVSPHRMNRPWAGAVEAPSDARAPAYDAACPLCPGNRRANGALNPAFTGPYAFDNDFPALLAERGDAPNTDDLFVSAPETGRCRVLTYSPDHGLSLSKMDAAQAESVIDLWAEECAACAADPAIAAITLFENRGAMMGASSPHPHGQIWATGSIPPELQTEIDRQAARRAAKGSALLLEYLDREEAAGERMVIANAHFAALVPYWAAWPFETMVLPRREVGALTDLDAVERAALADILRRLTKRYDRLFATAFPYTMGFHQRPTRAAAPGFVLHAHFFPPLLRSASVRKFMVGFEMLAMAQRDLTPEAAATRLRDCPEAD